MPDFTLQQTGAELQGLINKIAPTEEKVTQLESNGFYGITKVGTNISSDFEFPANNWKQLKKGDKLFLELSDIILDAGAIVVVLWAHNGNVEKYQLRYDVGGKQPCKAVWTIEENLIMRGVDIIKSDATTSYSATLKLAGNNFVDLYEQEMKLESQIVSLQNAEVELDSLSASNGYGFDKNMTFESGVTSAYHFPNKYISLKKGDKLYFEIKTADIVGNGSGGGAIAAVLNTETGQDDHYVLRYGEGETSPKSAIWTLEKDLDIRGIDIIKNAQVVSYKIKARFAGNNVAELYEQGKAIAEDSTKTTIVVASRNEANYNSIRELVQGLDANATNQFIVYVPKGRWFECDLTGKPYVKIIGEDVHETILYSDGASYNLTPNDYSFPTYANTPLANVNRSQKHCVNVKNDIYLENLTIETNDSKYCVHLDASGERKGVFRNCRFIAKKNMNYPLGFGVWANQDFKFLGCEIIQFTDGGDYCTYIHNWNNQKAISKVTFDKCSFNKSYVTCGELGSNYSCFLNFFNCISDVESPKIHINVEGVNGLSYWKDENGKQVTDFTLVPYSLKFNAIGTKLAGFVQTNRPNILDYVISENKKLL